MTEGYYLQFNLLDWFVSVLIFLQFNSPNWFVRLLLIFECTVKDWANNQDSSNQLGGSLSGGIRALVAHGTSLLRRSSIDMADTKDMKLVMQFSYTIDQCEEDPLHDPSYIFFNRCRVGNTDCAMMIDTGSLTNAASQTLVDRLGLVTKPHRSHIYCFGGSSTFRSQNKWR